MTTKEEVKALWQLCFEDSDEFVNLYFEKRYKDDMHVDIRLDGKVVSALQMVPYPMTFAGTVIDTSYVSGACTHPAYRKEGLMRQLLAETHRRMHEQDMWLSMLIPANKTLFDYYAESGYAPSFGYVRKRTRVSELLASALFAVSDETEDRSRLCEHYRYLSSRMKECPCCVQHMKDDFQLVMADLRLNGGKLLVARRNGLIHGMAFCVKENGMVVVKELLADNDAVRDTLLLEAMKLFQVGELDCLLPSSTDSLYLGMARVIHVERMLELVARKYPEMEMYLQIKGDDAIPENNGFYTLSQGNCVKGYLPDKDYRTYTVGDFTRLLLKAEHPYMSLMLN